MAHGTTVLGIDVGGTSTKSRLTGSDGALVAAARVATPQGDPEARRLAVVIGDLVADAAERGPLDAVGLVVPGVVDEARGTVVLAVNLGWHDVAVLDRVRDELMRRSLDVPVVFGHDVRAGALAEAQHADLEHGVVAFLPVGTGLASALVVDGTVVSGGGWAGEVGQVVIPSGPHAGRRVEEIASAGAVARRSRTVDARAALQRMLAGDPTAAGAWQDCVEVLGDVVAWTAAVSGCHTVVVGGGLAEAGELLLEPLRRAVAHRLVAVRRPDVVRARYGDGAGAVGAELLARRLARSRPLAVVSDRTRSAGPASAALR